MIKRFLTGSCMMIFVICIFMKGKGVGVVGNKNYVHNTIDDCVGEVFSVNFYANVVLGICG